jgi:hypothetical protein
VTTPAGQWQQCQGNNGNNASATRAMMLVQQSKVSAQQFQLHHCNNGKEASVTMAMAPSQQWQRGQHNNITPPSIMKHDTLLSSLHPPPLCRSRRCLAHHPPTAFTVFLFVVFLPASPTPFSYG